MMINLKPNAYQSVKHWLNYFFRDLNLYSFPPSISCKLKTLKKCTPIWCPVLWNSFMVTWNSKHIDTALSNFIKSGITQSIVLSSSLGDGAKNLESPPLHSTEIPYPHSWHPETFWHDPQSLPTLQGPCWKISVKKFQLVGLLSWELGSLYSACMCVHIYRYRDIETDMTLDVGQLFDLGFQKEERGMASFSSLSVIILTRIFFANTL